jgi:starvation-inducible outer membrane lipoprotein
MRFVFMLMLIGAIGLMSGCAAPPTQQEIDAADYGVSIEQADAEAKAKEVFARTLKDPYTAQLAFGQLYKGYSLSAPINGRKAEYGYMLDVMVNAKNSYGGYVGAKPYRFMFRNGRLIDAWRISDGGMLIPII